jgi:ketosteroid isomerase-like protein
VEWGVVQQCVDGRPSTDALFVTSAGTQLQGRGAARDAYEWLLPRMKSVRVNVERLVASGEVAFATMQLAMRRVRRLPARW